MSDNVEDEKYPDLYDEDGDDVVLHPIVDLLKEGHTLEGVVIEDNWTDDDEICLGVRAKCNGEEFRFALNWLSLDGFKMVVKAEMDDRDSIVVLTNHMIDYVSDMTGE
jgi:hypothetical protein